MADNKGKSRVTNFTTREDKALLNLLIDHYHNNTCNQGTFKTRAWNDIIRPFNDHTKEEEDKNNL